MNQELFPSQAAFNEALAAAGMQPVDPTGAAGSTASGTGGLQKPTKAFGVRVALIKVLPATTDTELYALHTIFGNDVAFIAPQHWDKPNHGLQPLAENPSAAQRIYHLSRISQIQEYSFLLAECKALKASGKTQKLIHASDIDAEQYPMFAKTYEDSPFSYLLYIKGDPAEITIDPANTLAMLDEFLQKPKGKRGK